MAPFGLIAVQYASAYLPTSLQSRSRNANPLKADVAIPRAAYALLLLQMEYIFWYLLPEAPQSWYFLAALHAACGWCRFTICLAAFIIIYSTAVPIMLIIGSLVSFPPNTIPSHNFWGEDSHFCCAVVVVLITYFARRGLWGALKSLIPHIWTTLHLQRNMISMNGQTKECVNHSYGPHHAVNQETSSSTQFSPKRQTITPWQYITEYQERDNLRSPPVFPEPEAFRTLQEDTILLKHSLQMSAKRYRRDSNEKKLPIGVQDFSSKSARSNPTERRPNYFSLNYMQHTKDIQRLRKRHIEAEMWLEELQHSSHLHPNFGRLSFSRSVSPTSSSGSATPVTVVKSIRDAPLKDVALDKRKKTLANDVVNDASFTNNAQAAIIAVAIPMTSQPMPFPCVEKPISNIKLTGMDSGTLALMEPSTTSNALPAITKSIIQNIPVEGHPSTFEDTNVTILTMPQVPVPATADRIVPMFAGVESDPVPATNMTSEEENAIINHPNSVSWNTFITPFVPPSLGMDDTFPAPSTGTPALQAYPSNPNLFDFTPTGSAVQNAVQPNHPPSFDMDWPSSSAPKETRNSEIAIQNAPSELPIFKPVTLDEIRAMETPDIDPELIEMVFDLMQSERPVPKMVPVPESNIAPPEKQSSLAILAEVATSVEMNPSTATMSSSDFTFSLNIDVPKAASAPSIENAFKFSLSSAPASITTPTSMTIPKPSLSVDTFKFDLPSALTLTTGPSSTPLAKPSQAVDAFRFKPLADVKPVASEARGISLSISTGFNASQPTPAPLPTPPETQVEDIRAVDTRHSVGSSDNKGLTIMEGTYARRMKPESPAGPMNWKTPSSFQVTFPKSTLAAPPVVPTPQQLMMQMNDLAWSKRFGNSAPPQVQQPSPVTPVVSAKQQTAFNIASPVQNQAIVTGPKRALQRPQPGTSMRSTGGCDTVMKGMIMVDDEDKEAAPPVRASGAGMALRRGQKFGSKPAGNDAGLTRRQELNKMGMIMVDSEDKE